MLPLTFGGSTQLTLILSIAVLLFAYVVYKVFWSE